MSESAIGAHRQAGSNSPERLRSIPTPEHDRAGPSVDTDELLALLSDDYARNVLEVISDEWLPAPEVAEHVDASRTTVYRRLNRLEEAGLVDTSMAYDADGHHRQQFRATVGQVSLSLDEEGVTVEHAT